VQTWFGWLSIPIFLISGALLLALALISLVQYRHNQWNKKQRSNSNWDASPAPLIAPKQPTYPTEEEHRSNEQAHWNWQQASENRRDIFNRAAFGLSVVAVIGAIYSASKSNDQAIAAQGQLTAMREEQRAWIKITIVPEAISWWKTCPNIELTSQIRNKNVGHVPALGVQYTVMGADSVKDIFELQRTSCRPSTGTRAIYPGDVEDASKLDFGRSVAGVTLEHSTATNFIIYGCTSYKADSSGPDHHTFFMYEVAHTTPAREMSYLFSPGVDVDAADLMITKDDLSMGNQSD
jgi:hypothetical protein